MSSKEFETIRDTGPETAPEEDWQESVFPYLENGVTGEDDIAYPDPLEDPETVIMEISDRVLPPPGQFDMEDVPDDLLDLFFADLGNKKEKRKFLNAEEEKALGKIIAQGSQADDEMKKSINPHNKEKQKRDLRIGTMAVQTMVQANLLLAVSVVSRERKQKFTNLDLTDDIANGQEGLLKAVWNFDWKRGFRVSTYATNRIRYYVRKGSAEVGYPVKYPEYLRERLTRINTACIEFEEKNGREPTDAELTQHVTLSEKEIRNARAAVSTFVSLDKPLGKEGGFSIIDTISDTNTAPDEEAINNIEAQQTETVTETIMRAGLNPREMQIIERHYGFYDDEEWSLSRIGKELGVSRQAISKNHARALNKIRKLLSDEEQEEIKDI